MGRTYEAIDDRLSRFLARQHVFFVATAPSGGDGHINLSPKGLEGTFAVIDPGTVAYLDLTGSGVETIAHLRENGRIVVMFCAFEGPDASCASTVEVSRSWPTTPASPSWSAASPPAPGSDR